MNYITRDKIITEACTNMLKEMYRRAQPSVDITLYQECYKNGILIQGMISLTRTFPFGIVSCGNCALGVGCLLSNNPLI